MGLDMYLSADLYLWNYKDEDDKLAKQIDKIIGDLPPNNGASFRDHRVKSIGLDVMYWRKSNAIHQWFVDNVQDGDDDCKRYIVDDNQLKQLMEICEEIIQVSENKKLSQAKKYAKWEELLPTCDGFFFGSTDYDEYYLEEAKRTYECLKQFLEHDITKRCDFYYQSSW